jgi:hypothetical protein
MRRGIPVLAVAGLIVLAACGSPADDIDPGAGGPDEPVSTTIDPNAPVPKGSPSITEPQPGQADVRPIPWDRYKAQGKTLRIKWWSGVEPCNVLDHVDVEETPEKVTVTLYEGHTESDEDVACIEIAVLKTTIVELSTPLGDRKVVDGAE